VKALTWHGAKDVRVERVGDPSLINPRDAIVRVTATAICGSDLHMYDGFIPMMKPGDVLGHEFMGEVVEKGDAVSNLEVGDRVVVPFAIACGACEPCRKGFTSLCDNSNPDAEICQKLYGYAGGGLFGYSHLYGGYSGGQAEYVRVPFADVGPIRIESDLSDEQVLFLSDIFPTGYQAAERCGIEAGDVVAVWGCGPVGQFAIRSAYLLGAERVIAIDRVESRLEMAAAGGAETLDRDREPNLLEALYERTGGRGPDRAIDCVGMEAHGGLPDVGAVVLHEAIQACGKGGTVSVPGVYGGFVAGFPMGALFAKGLTMVAGQTNVHRYLHQLLSMIERGEIDPSFVVTHRASLDQAPKMYRQFAAHDGCIKVVMTP
jgi:threonine dehydrogenase-like Zn-dependent dehydrogenase